MDSTLRDHAKFSWRLVILALIASLVLPLGAREVLAGTPSGDDRLGRVWQITEDAGWTGTWTRRGDSRVFDAVWFRGNEKVTGVLTMEIEDRTVTIQSRQQTNGSDVDYRGTISPEGGRIEGLLRVIGRPGEYKWSGIIDPTGSDQVHLGRAWQVTEDAGWTGTWTRRGSSLVFDAVWFRGSEKVTGVLTMKLQHRTVTIQSRQQTNGNDVDYEGTLSPDGQSIKGTLRVLGRAGSYHWNARIE